MQCTSHIPHPTSPAAAVAVTATATATATVAISATAAATVAIIEHAEILIQTQTNHTTHLYIRLWDEYLSQHNSNDRKWQQQRQ
jgi:uncharacterized protein YmfQ (DUF2313 family)